MILLIDNYDSFTYNLVQLAGTVNPDIRVVRNDEVSVEDVKEMSPTHIIISPGPGHPKKAGICEELIMEMKGKVPILGICLGHQAICEAFGASVVYAKKLMHGKQSTIHIANGNKIFYGLPPVIRAARYHSLAVQRDSLPDELLVIAEDESGEVMGVKHRDYEIYGLQFHPESILTPNGNVIMDNFLRIGGELYD
ncbi:anthranilate synthase component II [Thermoclostridium stercorarium subsp. stercorarium DSM 8532]|jgi:anthranilate synthase component 2|uniref:Anthranilate synthase component II n=3 Tax=Thermoclostridium stercorarium TaxID=1510 RepID=L7VRG7_THES1|nr:aminodeoxychorismate/anthranilate synthase component II [Thermoclostridium stercorarium]AGC68991.1 anthranilate synthase component II [Thermoclostridium stercorarium subsp. stercorarium DSM 8532]AGI39970.1 glutamine amidotransferase [Thermoclostridium stercorarium subsp. stercorarium DSM 8532]ANW99290.1 glutamine amidotransferase [Thermoclostridium stercorarium subsp. thermolacticum DSM 2910]ANX01919.1 glutamine amidotransferase [Thermoclostridium stercorarium subsp. leptospartum DSM 9219]U